MKLRDIVSRVIIDHRKLTEYALSLESPWGRHKAVIFEQALGFTRDNYAELLEQIEEKALDAAATFHGEDEFGQRYTVDVTVRGMEGRQAVVRTGWFVPHETDEARLVTLYVRR
ncbi:MAG: hypothetical protein HY730_01430 [Candidatus Tectomicrobia bacterium]|uniref:DUF6883 domain-containing protein n=1 Tax=Tectimicrobiota bacterium TaxID=2528274 RepID=A0A933GLL5_UNCTE|nr:hypothetical protein [Candidatus Tectomicrobia bacterium]